MSTSSSEILEQAEAELVAGDAGAAYQTVRQLLDHPAPAMGERDALAAALRVFARVAEEIGGPELGDKVAQAAADPDDPHALYEAAYALYEEQVFAIAATLLTRANELVPGQVGIVGELAAALEGILAYGPAALAVDASGLADSDPMLAYLSGFNWMMTGDVERAAARLAQLDDVTDATLVHVRGTLRGMLRRAQALAGAGIDIGDRALTAWHAILNGTLLLHESPYGHDDPMRGRYAYVSDSAGLMHEAIERVAGMLRSAGLAPPRVIAAPDRASTILATAMGRALSLPVASWPETTGPGLVVAWNLDTVGAADFLEAYKVHRPGEILFAHASAWVDPFPYAPDITTFLGQTITHPYTGGALRSDAVTKQVVPADPDLRDPSALADEILAAQIDPGSASAAELAVTIERALAGLAEEDRIGMHRHGGQRSRQWAGSPVPSNRFR